MVGPTVWQHVIQVTAIRVQWWCMYLLIRLSALFITHLILDETVNRENGNVSAFQNSKLGRCFCVAMQFCVKQSLKFSLPTFRRSLLPPNSVCFLVAVFVLLVQY
jgi:hypothetical protein